MRRLSCLATMPDVLRSVPGVFDQIIEGHPAPTLVVDRDFGLLVANRAARETLGEHGGEPGRRHAAVVGETIRCPDAEGPGGCGGEGCWACAVRSAVARALESGSAHRCVAVVRRRAGQRQDWGEAIRIAISAFPVYHAGNGLAVLTLETEAPPDRREQERMQAEQALRQSEERFRIAFQTSPDSININRLDDGIFLAVNEGFTRMTGWAEAEVLGRTSLELPVWDDPADRARLVAGLKENGCVQNLEARFRKKDGTTLVGLMSARLMTLGGMRYLLSITRDITDWKRAEEERDRLKAGLYQAAKMEAIGHLAGGVAHDFNNLLTVILAGTEVLQRGLRKGSLPDLLDIVGEIGAAGARARDLTRQLLTFARRQVIAPVPVDLNALVRSSERLLSRLLGEDISLATCLQPGLWSVRCDPAQIEQVVLNLAVNARDAMPRGGRITIETSNQDVEDLHAHLFPGIAPGPHVRLAIHDTGIGMAPEVKARLFEPFFTTKPVGKGTGLGLAMIHGIVKQSGGFIRVESEPGCGTTFEALFPRVSDAAATSAEPDLPEAARGEGTVLLVEDDLLVRSVTARLLSSGGYQLLVAANGPEALEILADHPTRLDLLITDVVMPGMDGRQLAEAVRKMWPGVQVLFVSGHAHDTLGKRGMLDDLDLLQKPYTSAALFSRVRAALARPPEPPPR